MQPDDIKLESPTRLRATVKVFICIVLFSMVTLFLLRIYDFRYQPWDTYHSMRTNWLPNVSSHVVSPGKVLSGKVLYISATKRGRLGNQMFQYASLLGIAHTNHRMDHAFYTPNTLLRNVFAVTHLGNRSTKGFTMIREKGSACYDAKFQALPEENVTVAYYLQSWKYFHHIQDVVRRELTFLPAVKSRAQQLLEKLVQARRSNVTAQIIGVHARRGDYVQQKVGKFKPPPPSFFVKAMQYYRSKYRHVLFLVVSEDPGWCKQHFVMDGVVIVPAAKAPVHLALLTLCDHIVVSLGSYGWWAGYLAGGDVVYYNNCVYPNMTAKRGFVAAEHFYPGWVGIGD